MKIAIVVHNLKGGGAEKMMVRLANALAEAGDEVSLVLLTGGGVNKALVAPAVSVVELCSPRTVMSLWRLRCHLRDARPDRILAALTHVNVIATLACASLGMLKRLYVSERNAFSRDKQVNPELLVRIAYTVAPLLYRLQPNPVICVSQGVAEDLVATTLVTERDVVWAPNPVLDNNFEQLSYGSPSHPWLQDKDVPTLVAAGRLANQKGFDLLIAAVARINASQPCRVVIFGEGELRAELLAQAEQLAISDKVSLPGYCTDVLAEMAHSDLFVLSSRFEGSPNVLVEAMATGVPVVATDCPYGPDEILEGGRVAPLVPAEDVAALAAAIVSALNDSNDGKAQRWARARRYTSANAAAAYRHILATGSPPAAQTEG